MAKNLSSNFVRWSVAGAAIIMIAAGVAPPNAEQAAVGATMPAAAIASPPVPIPPPNSSDTGFIQFNNLTVQSVSASNPPAEIVANAPGIVPMMSTYGASAAGGQGTCYKFDSQDAARGSAIACPQTESVNAPASAPSEPSGSSGQGTMMYPIRYQPYRIEVSATTNLYLRDRTAANLSDFTAGDQINVFGYYNADGSIQAYLIRDLSKPAQSQFMQLNNVQLVSVAANTVPTTVVVAQNQGYPCYGFDAQGGNRQSIACPMGLVAPSTGSAMGSAMQNIVVPPSLAPIWNVTRKYVINIDSKTVLLDRSRTQVALSDLKPGDEMNIYGDTMDNGQTINADIVRDLSLPATASTYSGKISQVNADGSFVIQTNDGQTITVPNPVRAGATVQITGLLDRISNVLSQVTNMIIGTNAIFAPLPSPAGPGATPNAQN